MREKGVRQRNKVERIMEKEVFRQMKGTMNKERYRVRERTRGAKRIKRTLGASNFYI